MEPMKPMRPIQTSTTNETNATHKTNSHPKIIRRPTITALLWLDMLAALPQHVMEAISSLQKQATIKCYLHCVAPTNLHMAFSAHYKYEATTDSIGQNRQQKQPCRGIPLTWQAVQEGCAKGVQSREGRDRHELSNSNEQQYSPSCMGQRRRTCYP